MTYFEKYLKYKNKYLLLKNAPLQLGGAPNINLLKNISLFATKKNFSEYGKAVDKKKARLNCIDHLLSLMPYSEIEHPAIELPARVRNPDYIRHPVPADMYVPDRY